jgi:hypothetical protein
MPEIPELPDYSHEFDDLHKLMGAQAEMVEDIKKAGLWEESFEDLVGKVDPLSGLPYLFDQMKLQDLPMKADAAELVRASLPPLARAAG